MKEIILINQYHLKKPLEELGFQVTKINTYEEAVLDIHRRKHFNKAQALGILCEMETNGSYKNLIDYIESKKLNLPVIVITDQHNAFLKKEAFDAGAADYFYYGLNLDDLVYRIEQLHGLQQEQHKPAYKVNYKMPIGKRVFDMVVSGFLLTMFSPLFIVIGLLIKLTSKGPIFYSSPRVGTGYKIFPFYKFRSMRVNADHMIKDMQHLNHYANDEVEVEKETIEDVSQPMLFSDDGFIDEIEYQAIKKQEEKRTFVKFQNDPRITKIGHFIRKTSIDELPQLINVLLGHMSIVGNRPLPLYEAEKLTSDMWALRFMAPAGITGLWQVTERGKANTTADSRKLLDLTYAENYSVWMDLKILLKTPLAAIQQEKV